MFQNRMIAYKPLAEMMRVMVEAFVDAKMGSFTLPGTSIAVNRARRRW
jgi:hypothetical protein